MSRIKWETTKEKSMEENNAFLEKLVSNMALQDQEESEKRRKADIAKILAEGIKAEKGYGYKVLKQPNPIKYLGPCHWKTPKKKPIMWQKPRLKAKRKKAKKQQEKRPKYSATAVQEYHLWRSRKCQSQRYWNKKIEESSWL